MPKEQKLREWLESDPDAALIWHDGNAYPSIGTVDMDGWAWLQGSPFDTSIVEASHVDVVIRADNLATRTPLITEGNVEKVARALWPLVEWSEYADAVSAARAAITALSSPQAGEG